MGTNTFAVTVFRGRVGDHNDRAMAGSELVGAALAEHLDRVPVTVGVPAPALATGWQDELDAARTDLAAMAAGTRKSLVPNRFQPPR
jgi:hypothetical protein